MDTNFENLMTEGVNASLRGEVEGALAAWRRAVSIDPRSARPHLQMGNELALARRMREAETAFANAVLLAPELETARYQLGLMQFSSGRAAVASVTWMPLLQLLAGHPMRSFVQGFAAMQIDDSEGALRHFAAGVEANPTDTQMNSDIAEVVTAIQLVRALNAVSVRASVSGGVEIGATIPSLPTPSTLH